MLLAASQAGVSSMEKSRVAVMKAESGGHHSALCCRPATWQPSGASLQNPPRTQELPTGRG